MVRADYSYTKLTLKDSDFIVIQDLNRGGMSVTNDMENVLKEIADDSGLNLEKTKIIYQDSRGIYDGVMLKNGSVRFVSLNVTDALSAMKIFLSKQI